MKTRVVTIGRLFGGYQKQQRRNFVPVPPGSNGVMLTLESHPEFAIEMALCRFELAGRYVYVRCAVHRLERNL